MRKRYRVTLTEEERQELSAQLRRGRVPASRSGATGRRMVEGKNWTDENRTWREVRGLREARGIRGRVWVMVRVTVPSWSAHRRARQHA